MKRKQHDGNAHHIAALFLWILGGTFVLILSFFLLCYGLINRIHYVTGTETPTLSQAELDDFMKKTGFPGTASCQIHSLGSTRQECTNILLIGQDRREGEPRARADCMILCTLCTESSELIMTSFLRDLYVRIPGYRNNRLNAAYAAGGMPLLKQTFQENFGIPIDGCIEVDFRQFTQLIDQLGGITLLLRQDEADLLNEAQLGAPLHPGRQTLCGDQALAYARIRSLDSDGDFSRTTRQRNILKALFQRCQQTSLPDTLGFIKTAMPMLTTDLPKSRLLSLARELFPLLPKMSISGQHIPVEGSYSYDTIQGMSVLVADLESNRRFLEKQFYNR